MVGKIQNIGGNSMFGGWDAALVNQDYEINWLISPQYEGVTKRFTEKLAGVVLGGKVGFIDIHNRFIIKPQFENADDIHGFNLGLSAVKKNGKFGFINKKMENLSLNLNLITLIILEITCWLQSSKMVSSGLLI